MGRDVMPIQFPVFEMFLRSAAEDGLGGMHPGGDVVICGSEGSRHAANYKAYRALFLLLRPRHIG